jgi:hypothetical protein
VAFRVDVDARQPLDRLREVVLGARIIGAPAAAATIAAAVVRESRERPFFRLAGQRLVRGRRVAAAKAALGEYDRGRGAEQHNCQDQARSSFHPISPDPSA